LEITNITPTYITFLQQREKPSTKARKISCLNSFFLFLFKNSFISKAYTLKRPPVQLPTAETIPHELIASIFKDIPLNNIPSVKPYRDRSILGILYATGIKSIELSSICLQDINLEAQSITIRPARKKQRTVFFGMQTKQDLLMYLHHERPQAQSSAEYLFLSIHKTPLTTRSIQRICLHFGELLEPKRVITPKILRHSFALHLLERGTSLERLQELLGHATSASTERYIQ
jgi:integrase/recombinase XerD